MDKQASLIHSDGWAQRFDENNDVDEDKGAHHDSAKDADADENKGKDDDSGEHDEEVDF